MKILSLSDRVAVVVSLCTLGVVVLGAYAFVQPHNAITSYHASEWNFLAEDLNHVIDSVHSHLSGSASSSRQIALSKVRGGVVSHHIPQTFPELALFYLRLKEHQDVRRFIVLGPDHVNAGRSAISVSNQSFVTSFGELEPIPGCAEHLERQGAAFIEEGPFGPEHSIGSQILLISRIFPGREVTPIIFRSDATSAQAQKLSEELSKCIDDETVIIASVDFSHYLSESQARPIDELSGQIVRDMDKAALELVDADSGKSMETYIDILTRMRATSTADVRVLNTNDVMQNNDYTTGYVFGYWGVQYMR